MLALAACAGRPRPPDLFDERLAGVIPAAVNDWWFTVSRDGSTPAWAERRDSQAFVNVGQRRYGPYV